MTTALFVHDHKFARWDGDVFSNQFPYETLKRYLSVFDTLTVVGRVRDDIAVGRGDLSKATGDRVRFVFLDSISSPGSALVSRRIARRVLTQLVEEVDATIVRLPSELGLMAAGVARKLDQTYAVELAGCSWDALWYHGRHTARLYAPLQYARTRRAVHRASHVLYVTRDYLQSRYPPGVIVQHTSVSGVAIPEINEDVLGSRWRPPSLRDRHTRVGVIGSLRTKYKGVHVAIKAIARLAAKGRDIELRILGDGDTRPYVNLASRLGIADRVFFDGTVAPGEAVIDWLDGIDVYIQPSLTEGLPRSLIEAMSRGCPAVASRVGGIPELLPNEFLFTARDVGQLAKLIDAFINSRDLRARASRENFCRAKDYRSGILDARRHDFLSDLAHHTTIAGSLNQT